jgi:hypothetical protein
MTESGGGHPRSLLSEYMDDALEIEARQSVDRHLASCEDCRAELAAMRRLTSAVAEEPVPPVPAELAARIGRRLDAATVARPRFRRFVLPATIAATIGAVGLLVVVQWREGRFPSNAVVPREEPARAADELKSTNAPAAPAPAPAPPERRVKEQEAPAPEALDKDVKRAEEPAVEEDLRDKKTEAVRVMAEKPAPAQAQAAAPAGTPGGVVGSAVGGIERNEAAGADEGVSGAREDAARQRAEGVSKFSSLGYAPPAAKAKVAGEPTCTESWTDSGLRGSWEVADIDAAERDLGRISHTVGGIGLWRGVSSGQPYIVVVPRGRIDEVVFALRARGVTGLPNAIPPAEAGGCTGIFVALKPLPFSPAPR